MQEWKQQHRTGQYFCENVEEQLTEQQKQVMEKTRKGRFPLRYFQTSSLSVRKCAKLPDGRAYLQGKIQGSRTMKLLFCTLIILVLLSTPICAQKMHQTFHFLQDDFPKGSTERKIAEFLIAHMSYAEFLNTSPEDFKNNVLYCALARKTMPWGKSIPEDIFLNYVCPNRIAQEGTTRWRQYLFAEITPLVAQCETIKEAALKINDWLTSKVFFAPTDARDLAPLDVLKRGFGRCEELNILYIAALRSVAIPARSVWTPAWKHTDGNHAWVEVYLDDGRWHYTDPSWLQEDFDNTWFTPFLQTAPVVMTSALTDICKTYKRFDLDRICVVTDRYANTIPITVNKETLNLLLEHLDGIGKIYGYVMVFNGGRLRPVLSHRFTNLDSLHWTFSITPGDYVLAFATRTAGAHYGCLHVSPEGNYSIEPPRKSLNTMFCTFRPVRPTGKTRLSPGLRSRRQKQAEKVRKISDGIFQTVKSWKPTLSDRLAHKLATAGKRAFEIMALAEGLQQKRRDRLWKLLELMNSKDLVDIGIGELKKLAISRANIKVENNLEQEIVDYFLINPRIYYEPPAWHYEELAKIIGPVKQLSPKTVSLKAAQIARLVQQIRKVPSSFCQELLTPLQVIKHLKATRDLEILVTTASLFRAAGIPAQFVPYAETVLIYDGKAWNLFRPEMPEKPLEDAGFSVLELSFRTEENKCINPESFKYMKDFGILRWTKGQPKPVKRVRTRRDTIRCSTMFELLPGRYDIFHKHTENTGKKLVSIVSIDVKPGKMLNLLLTVKQ